MSNQSTQHPSSRLTGTDSGRIAPSVMERDDAAQIGEIVGRLERRYTREQISTADLTSRVRSFHRGFSTARIRNFIGILVERLVRRSIEDSPSNS